ncbi:MAG TPA: alpha/beta hydrolase [Candidatus Acidoferrales bacterium]|nr:alpha/beta hydrolase [Candidatus Acidoferrales bacterium]
MPNLSINESPRVEGAGPVQIHYRETGSGFPLLFLHGGWGYEIYPFDRQIEALRDRFRILIPDRSGYGCSGRIPDFPVDFHQRAAGETLRFLDALRIRRAVLWGHSDGAVIAGILGLGAPERVSGIIFEAFHFYRVKPGSRKFFEELVSRPEGVGERVARTLAQEHGEDYWKELMRNGGRAWLKIADGSSHPEEDLYGCKLSELKVPAMFLHGSRDPRTEPGELDAVRRQLPHTPLHVIEGAGHSPHNESGSAAECNRLANEFLQGIRKELIRR